MLSIFWGSSKPVLAIDLDGTLCYERPIEQWKYYAEALPKTEEISILQKIAAKYFIVIWTSRFEADREVTLAWLQTHKVPFDRLIMGKMLYSIVVDANAHSSLKEMDK